MNAAPLSSIFLTGGTGFIGSQLAQYASQRGHRVTVVSPVNNDTERFRRDMLTRSGITVVEASLDDAQRTQESLRGQDCVIHLAAAQHEAEASEDHFHRVNVEGTRSLLELAARAGVRRFIYGSTIGVYGESAGGVLDETSPLAPDNPYGRTKAQAEGLVRSFADRIEVTIVRISETYGPGDMRLLKLFRAIARGRYVTLGRGNNERQLVYVEDLNRGLLAAAHAPAACGETIILAGHECLTTDAMVGSICDALGTRRRNAHLPLWPFDLAAAACEACLPPLGIRPPLHRRRLDFFRKSFRLGTAKAQTLLGFNPQVCFADGARLTAAWYRDNGFL